MKSCSPCQGTSSLRSHPSASYHILSRWVEEDHLTLQTHGLGEAWGDIIRYLGIQLKAALLVDNGEPVEWSTAAFAAMWNTCGFTSVWHDVAWLAIDIDDGFQREAGRRGSGNPSNEWIVAILRRDLSKLHLAPGAARAIPPPNDLGPLSRCPPRDMNGSDLRVAVQHCKRFGEAWLARGAALPARRGAGLATNPLCP